MGLKTQINVGLFIFYQLGLCILVNILNEDIILVSSPQTKDYYN